MPRTADDSRDFKRRLVETGRAHAALVFEGETAVGRAQNGSPDELPGISHRKEYLEGVDVLPDYRIAYFFVDRRLPPSRNRANRARRSARARRAVRGSDRRELSPTHRGQEVSASFLYNATRSTFEHAGFTYDGPKGKNHCIMRTTVSGRPDGLCGT